MFKLLTQAILLNLVVSVLFTCAEESVLEILFPTTLRYRTRRSPQAEVPPPEETTAKQKVRTTGWGYEASLPKCSLPRPYKGKWKIPNIAAVGKKKNCNRGINYREDREQAKAYLQRKIDERNAP